MAGGLKNKSKDYIFHCNDIYIFGPDLICFKRMEQARSSCWVRMFLSFILKEEAIRMIIGEVLDVKVFSKLICIYIYFVSWE
jgi:hypothetical protein